MSRFVNRNSISFGSERVRKKGALCGTDYFRSLLSTLLFFLDLFSEYSHAPAINKVAGPEWTHRKGEIKAGEVAVPDRHVPQILG